MMKELEIQNRIRKALSAMGGVVTFRNNVGKAYQGEVIDVHPDRITLRNHRLISFGLTEGSSDLIGYTSVTITPDMVGRKVAIFTALEIKQPGRQATPLQRNFIHVVKDAGGRAGVCTDISGAQSIIKGAI